MVKLDANQIQARNAWFKTIFFPFLRGTIDKNGLFFDGGTTFEDCVEGVKRIYDTIVNLKFMDVDNDIKAISKNDSDAAINAMYLASFCQEKEIYFDDYIAPKYTAQEIAAFKSTLLGKALVDCECFISQDPSLQVTQPAAPTPRTVRTAPISAGKPNIANCNGLVDKVKVPMSGNVYWIGGSWLTPGKTTPRVHVKPLRSTNSQGQLEVFTNGSGQGYEDMVLFWPNSMLATDVANKIDQTKHGPKVANYQVKRQTAKGDYYKVNTEFGEAYIQADRLVEMIEDYKKRFAESMREFFKNLD